MHIGRLIDKDNYGTIVEVALLKYRMGLTQAQIAELLGVSTMQVSRLLEKAKQEGIIRIEIDAGFSADSELEAQLKKQYSLKHALVVRTSKILDPIDTLVRAAAMYIDLIVASDSVIGIAGGRTVMRIIPYLKLPLVKPKNDIRVVQLTGGMLNTKSGNPIITLHEFTSRFNAKGYFLNTPIYVPSARLSNYLDISGFEKISELWKQCTICLGSVGALGKDFLFYEEETITKAHMDEVERKGAVGNVFGRWIDENGDYIDCELNKMVISLPGEILLKIPNRVLVTGAYERLKGVRAVLKKRLFNICIVTDTIAADLV